MLLIQYLNLHFLHVNRFLLSSYTYYVSLFLHTRQGFPWFSSVLTNLILHTHIWPGAWGGAGGIDTNWITSPVVNVKMLGVDVTYGISFEYGGHQCIGTWLVNGTPTLNSNAGDQKVYKKKNLSWLFGADRKTRPLGSLFCRVMPNSGPRTDFSVGTSHLWKILIFCTEDSLNPNFQTCRAAISWASAWSNNHITRVRMQHLLAKDSSSFIQKSLILLLIG